MNSYDVVGYAYEADIHCPGCARERFPDGNLDAHHEDLDCPKDSEGDPVTPVFADSDTPDAGEFCGTCGECIKEAPQHGYRVTLESDTYQDSFIVESSLAEALTKVTEAVDEVLDVGEVLGHGESLTIKIEPQ